MVAVQKSIYSDLADNLIMTDQTLTNSLTPKKKPVTTPFLDYQKQKTTEPPVSSDSGIGAGYDPSTKTVNNTLATPKQNNLVENTSAWLKSLPGFTEEIGQPKVSDESTPVPVADFVQQYLTEYNAPSILFKNRGGLSPSEEMELKRVETDWLGKATKAYEQKYGQGSLLKANLRALPKKVGDVTMMGQGVGTIASKALEPTQGLGTVSPLDIAFGAADVAPVAGMAVKPIAKGAQILAKEAKPLLKELATSEAGFAKLGKGLPDEPITPKVETPPINNVPPTGNVPPKMPPTGGSSTSGILGDLQNTDELVTVMTHPDNFRKIANLPGVKNVMSYLNPAGVAKTSAEKAVVARAALHEEGANKAIGAFSRLETLGARDKVWGKLDDTLSLTEGKLKGKSLDEVLTYRNKYANDLTPEQAKWAESFHELETAKLDLLERNGIPINQLSFEEGGEYVGRRVVGKIDPRTGELAESAFIGAPGPGRPGAHLSAEKTRYFVNVKEAIDQGFRYLPPDEALYLNLKGAYNRVADKQIADWVLDKVAWRGTGAPKALVEATTTAKNNLNKSQALLAALNRGLRGERGVPEQIVSSIATEYPAEASTLKNLLTDIRAGKPTGNAVQQFENKANNLINSNKAQYWQAVDARTKAREMAMQTHFGESRIQAPAFAGKIFTGPEAKETADTLARSFNTSYGDIDKIITSVNKVNSIGRYFALAGDASPFMIQLITFPARFPKTYGKAMVEFTKALFSPASQAKYLAKNNGIIQKSRNLILSKGGQTEFTEAFRDGGIMQSKIAKYPKAVLEPFQRGFEAAVDTSGIELRKAFDHLCTTPQRTAEVEQFINEVRGVTSSARLGVTPAMRAAETAAILAPRYNRAIFALVSDIANGGIRGDQARKAVAALIAGGTALATGVTLARGEGWEGVKDHLDITNSSQFLTWDVAGQKIGPGSKLRSLTVLLGRFIKNPNNMVGDSFNFLRGNFAPVVSTGYDILTGTDYIGDPTRPGKGKYIETGFGEGMLALSKRVLADNLLPIWLQSVALQGGDIEQRLTRGTSEFFGGRSYPFETSRLYAEKWAKDFDAYNAIPSYNSVELAAAKKTNPRVVTREQYREKNPGIEAKLFITGQVSTISTPAAATYVRNLITTNKINPMDIKGIASNIVDKTTTLTETDKLIKSLGLSKGTTATPTPTPTSTTTTTTTSTTPSSTSLQTNEQKWSAISSPSGVKTAFGNLWYGTKPYTKEQETLLRNVFKQYPLGQTDFYVWSKQTVRQIFDEEYARINK